MIRGLIFDFDGLILETESPIFQSWQELYWAHNRRLSLEDWAEILGTANGNFDPFEELERQVGTLLDRTSLASIQKQRESELIAAQPVLPGVVDYLSGARQLGLKVGLASSSPCAWITGHLTRLELIGYFDCILASDDVRQTKPDPELFLATLDYLDLAPCEAIVFEDSPNGILAARRAGIFCVAVPNALTRRLPLDLANLRLNSLADLPLTQLLLKVGDAQNGSQRKVS